MPAVAEQHRGRFDRPPVGRLKDVVVRLIVLKILAQQHVFDEMVKRLPDLPPRDLPGHMDDGRLRL